MKAFTTLLALFAISAITANTIPQAEKRLIQTSEKTAPVWMTENEVFDLIRNRKHFFDVTDHQNEVKFQPDERAAAAIPTKVSYPTLVKAAIAKIDKSGMSKFLTSYSAIYNRYYTSTYGVQASNFLLEQVKQAAAGYTGPFTASLYKHTWAQSSVIARIEGTDLKSEVVVIGAHMDSINLKNPSSGIAPGADDDGSGTTSVLEILRILANSNFKPRRTIEFQFYAAEEVGLRGSQAIAQDYASKKVNVVGMLQLDMTGYNESKRIKLLTDYTDPALTQFTRLMIDNYSTYKWFNGQCGYACSDHASYNRAGYKAAQPGEDIINNRLHTPQDTTQFVNYDHVSEFVKLGLGYAIELAEPATK